MFNTTVHAIVLGILIFLINHQVYAFEEQPQLPPCFSKAKTLENSIQQAKVITRVPPKYPQNAARKKQEGWVRLSFVIKEDGSVELPIVEDSSGIQSFEKAAKKAVRSWKFNPATRNGKAIQQCKNSVQLDFKMNKKASGASRGFAKQYREVSAFIHDKNLVEAKQSLEALASRTKQNFYEDKFFFNISASYYQALGDHTNELISLKKLIPQGKDYLPKDTYVYSITRAFQLAMANNELSSALYYYEKLTQFDQKNERVFQLKPYVEQIETVISSPKHILVAAQINERSHWRHYLARNKFTFTDIKGEVNAVDIRCANHFSSHKIDNNKEWKIPDSWGKCQLFVKGAQGATFNLVELAAKSV